MIRAVSERRSPTMMSRLLVPVLLFVAVTASAAAECPTREGDQILDLLGHAPTCEKSLALFQDCAYGASGDVGLSEVVIGKCEGDFLTRLNRSQRRAYEVEQKRCGRKYQKESGSMYRSFEAFCRANLAKALARRFAEGPKR
jgi:hypothetical protein